MDGDEALKSGSGMGSQDLRTADDQRDPQTYAVLGAAMEVHRELGPGYLERVYQDAMALELAARAVPFLREARLPVVYKGCELPSVYRADFICFGAVLVELKTLKALTTAETSQMIHYLRTSRIERGLLLNFGAARLGYRRFVLTRGRAASEAFC